MGTCWLMELDVWTWMEGIIFGSLLHERDMYELDEIPRDSIIGNRRFPLTFPCHSVLRLHEASFSRCDLLEPDSALLGCHARYARPYRTPNKEEGAFLDSRRNIMNLS